MAHVLKYDSGMDSKLPSKATIVKWQGKWRVLGWYSSVFVFIAILLWHFRWRISQTDARANGECLQLLKIR